MVPKQLDKQVVEWYHNALWHPRKTRTELSFSQHFYWKNLCKTVNEIFTKHSFQKCKKQYGKLPPKETETKPWDTLCVDQIGKYQFTPKGGGKKLQILPKGYEQKYEMTTKSGKPVYSEVVTMTDPATG